MRRLVKLILVFLCCMMAVLPAEAKEIDSSRIRPAVSADRIVLGTDELELEVGETYVFPLVLEPEDASAVLLQWYADETVIHADKKNFSVSGLRPGSTRLLVETHDGAVWAECRVTVRGQEAKDASALKSGAERIVIAEKDLAKFSAPVMKRYLDFLKAGTYTDPAFEGLQKRIFAVTADVTDGSEEAESRRALELGMIKASPLPDLNAVSMRGTLPQILAFAAGNEDLIRLIEIPVMRYEDRSTSVSSPKALNLDKGHGFLNNISSISSAHDLGLKGKGTAVAVIDTGINKNHEQFKGRVAAEACFTMDYYVDDTFFYQPVCTGNSSEPDGALLNWQIIDHGSNVTGIAAGRDGIAPQAQIVSICNAQQFCELGSDGYYYCEPGPNMGDIPDMFQWLITKQKEFKSAGKPLISAVNLSQGLLAPNSAGKLDGFSSFCDSSDEGLMVINSYLKKLLESDIIAVFSSGNDGFDDKVEYPACLQEAYSVGSVAVNYPQILISNFSNHSSYSSGGKYLLDILAPGEQIYSAGYWDQYVIMDGTSQAAPMVSGAMAILRQAFPLRTTDEYKSMLRNISSVSTKYRCAAWNDSGTYPRGCVSYYTEPIAQKKILNFAGTSKFLHIANRWVIGYSDGVLVKVPISPINSSNPKYTVTAVDVKTNKKTLSNVTIVPTEDPTGKYWKISLQNSKLEPGRIYKLQITQTSPYKTNTVTKYATPLRSVIGVTASPKNKAVTINGIPVSYSDGTRLFIREASGGKRVDTKYITGTDSALWTKSGLTNGKLYEVVANSYILYNKTYLWGSTISKVYFMPLSTPSGAKVTWSNSTTAKISMTKDSSVNGLRVLYRETGGAIKNGCESTGNNCSIKNLKKSGAYEFYVMKYKNSPSGKRHYGPGIVLLNNSTASGLKAPANPTIQSGSNKFTVTIKKDSAAKGISVLYRQNDGNFQLLCEAASNTCAKKMSVDIKSRYYTFYIMQYKVVNGKKVYSPGTIAKNLSSPKSAEIAEPVYSIVNEEIDINEIYDALPDYLTEEESYNEEVLALLIAEGSMESFISKDLEADSPEFEFDDEIELAGDFDLVEGPIPEDEPDDGDGSGEDSEEGSSENSSNDPNKFEFYRLDDEERQHDPTVPSFR